MPELVTVANVPLLEVGTWETSTGTFTWTTEHLAAAVAAQDDPALRTPILKLGHVDPRFDGEPAVGRIENLRLSEDRMTLIGDFVGVPAWLAEIMASAFPSRSIEGWFEWKSATGSKHPFVITACALLGVTAPAVETLDDIAELYGVAAAQQPSSGTHVLLEVNVPAPKVPRRAAAGVRIDDVISAFYDARPDGSWAWVREVWSDALIVDNDDGELFQIPWSADDAGVITFGTPVEVIVQYVPAPPDEEDQEESDMAVLLTRFTQPVAASAAPTAPVPGQKGGPAMDFTKLRADLGLGPETSEEEVLQALSDAAYAATQERDDALAKLSEAKPSETPELRDGVVTIEKAVLDDMREQIAASGRIAKRYHDEERERVLASALSQGKVHPSRKAYWEAELARDFDGASKSLASLEPGAAVPLSEIGHAGAGADTDDDAFFARIAPSLAIVKEA